MTSYEAYRVQFTHSHAYINHAMYIIQYVVLLKAHEIYTAHCDLLLHVLVLVINDLLRELLSAWSGAGRSTT